MRITFNTSQPNAPCSMFYSAAFSGLEGLEFYDKRLDLYDVALFMTYDYQLMRGIRELLRKTTTIRIKSL